MNGYWTTIIVLMMIASTIYALWYYWCEANWDDIVAAYRYSKDPHGYVQRRKAKLYAKWATRPAMYRAGNTWIAHPALEARLRRELRQIDDSFGPSVFASLTGFPVFVTTNAVQYPPEGGWADVEVPPEKPRLAA